MPRLTDEQREELGRLEKAATPGPWESGGSTPTPGEVWIWEQTGHHPGDPDAPDTRIACCGAPDAALIAAARNALPALLAEVDALRGELAATKRAIDFVSRPLVLDRADSIAALATVTEAQQKRAETAEAELTKLRAILKADPKSSLPSLAEHYVARAEEQARLRAELAAERDRRINLEVQLKEVLEERV